MLKISYFLFAICHLSFVLCGDTDNHVSTQDAMNPVSTMTKILEKHQFNFAKAAG